MFAHHPSGASDDGFWTSLQSLTFGWEFQSELDNIEISKFDFWTVLQSETEQHNITIKSSKFDLWKRVQSIYQSILTTTSFHSCIRQINVLILIGQLDISKFDFWKQLQPEIETMWDFQQNFKVWFLNVLPPLFLDLYLDCLTAFCIRCFFTRVASSWNRRAHSTWPLGCGVTHWNIYSAAHWNPALPTSKFNLVFAKCRSLTWYFQKCDV